MPTYTRCCLFICLFFAVIVAVALAQNHVLSLDGDGDYVEIADSESLNAINSQVTLEAWIKVNMFTGEWTFFIHKGDEQTFNLSNRSYGLSLNRSGFLNLASAPSGKEQMSLNSPNGSIALNTWYHVTGVINAKNGVMRIFLNGAEVASGDFGKDIHARSNGRLRLTVSALPLWIGWTHEESHGAFAGQIDEVRIWNVARTPEEIAATMHTSLSGKEPGLVGYWQFEGEGGTVIDATGNGHDGQFIGDVVRVTSELPTRVVKVVVTDAGGNPLSDATVFLQQEGKKIAEGKTGSSGVYHFSAYPAPGGYKIYAIHGKLGDWKSISLRQGERQTLSLTLKPVIPALIAALSDADDKVRQNAAWMLAEFGASATAAAPVLKQALNDSNEKVRRYAVWALAELNELPHETAPALIEAALTDESYEVRRDVTEALGRMDTPPTAAVPGLTKALADESYEVRRNAAGALAQIGAAATAAVPALIQMLNDENEEVRQKAAWALKRIGIPGTMANVYALREKANARLLLGIFITIGTVHLLLFLFYPKSVDNLYYAVLIGNIVLVIGLWVVFSPVPDGTPIQRVMLIIGLGIGLSGLRFLYALFYTRLPKQFWGFLALWIPLGVGLYLAPDPNSYDDLWVLVGLLLALFLLGAGVEMFRVLLMAIIRKKDGAWVISLGFMAMIAVFIAKVVNDSAVGSTPLRFLDEAVLSLVTKFAFLGLLISASTYLARNFARTSKALEAKNAQLATANQQIHTLNEQLKDELQDAHNVQMSLMPDTAPSLEGLELAGRCLPANTVSGDFFDYVEGKQPNEVTLVVADVCGKAMKGAMNAVMTDGILHASAIEQGHFTPASLMTTLNKALKGRLERYMNVTMVIGTIDADANTLSLANAAHHAYPILLRHGAVDTLKTGGMPLGMMTGIQYTQEQFTLQSGDVLILMTDGIIEAQANEKQYSDSGRLETTISQFTPAMPAEAMVEAIINDAIAFGGEKAQRDDDMTVVVAKIQ